MNALAQLARKVRLSIGLGLVKLVDDAKRIQQMQITLLSDEVRDRANRYQDYGFTSVPLDGAECVTAAVGGNRSHTIIIRCDDGRHRKRDLQPGESAMYSDEGDFIYLKRNREMEVLSGGKVYVTAPEVIVNAATRVVIDSPTCELSGDLAVAGDVTCQGTVQGGVVETAAGIDLDTHRHSGVLSGGANTGLPL